jgi:hypothetical protein
VKSILNSIEVSLATLNIHSGKALCVILSVRSLKHINLHSHTYQRVCETHRPRQVDGLAATAIQGVHIGLGNGIDMKQREEEVGHAHLTLDQRSPDEEEEP